MILKRISVTYMTDKVKGKNKKSTAVRNCERNQVFSSNLKGKTNNFARVVKKITHTLQSMKHSNSSDKLRTVMLIRED